MSNGQFVMCEAIRFFSFIMPHHPPLHFFTMNAIRTNFAQAYPHCEVTISDNVPNWLHARHSSSKHPRIGQAPNAVAGYTRVGGGFSRLVEYEKPGVATITVERLPCRSVSSHRAALTGQCEKPGSVAWEAP